MKKKYSLLFFLSVIAINGLSGASADHLIFKRISTVPNESESIAIYNPTQYAIPLNNLHDINNPNRGSYFLTDGYVSDDSYQHYTNVAFINTESCLNSLGETMPLWESTSYCLLFGLDDEAGCLAAAIAGCSNDALTDCVDYNTEIDCNLGDDDFNNACVWMGNHCMSAAAYNYSNGYKIYNEQNVINDPECGSLGDL
jgi:hypothetical protein